METEKNKIEFWYEGNDVVKALMNNKTNEMMTKTIEKTVSDIPGISFFMQEVE